MGHFHQLLVSRELGGAGLVALKLARSLKDRDQDSHVWIPGPGPALQKAHILALKAHNYNNKGIFSASRATAIIRNWEIGYKLRKYRPGLIHIHSPLHYRALRLGLRMSELKCLVHIQIEEEAEGLRWALQDPPDLIITCARFLQDHVKRTLPECLQSRQQIVAISNPVDTQLFFPGDKSPAKKRVGAPENLPMILMLANLAPHKGQETAIRCIAGLKERGTPATLWLAGVERHGEQSYTEYLHTLTDELRVRDRVRFLGYRDDAPDLLRAADIFLLPSTHEGLPLSILEAQATKVPVVASPIGGIPEVVNHEETGILVLANDVQNYVEHINQLLTNSTIYHHITEQAFQKSTKEYNWDAYTSKIWSIYQEMMKK